MNLLQAEKLRKEEALQLEDLRQKRLSELESKMKEIEEKNEEEEINNLMKRERDLSRKLQEIKRKVFQLKLEASSWESIAKTKTYELKNLDKKLNECYEEIWSSRDKFCEEVDHFLEDFTLLSQKQFSQTEYYPENEKGLEKKLQESIKIEEDLEKKLAKRLKKLDQEKEKLEEEINSEKKRLEEWIHVTHERCLELKRRIQERKTLTDAKNDFQNSQLFSIVNLEDVKKFNQNLIRQVD